MKTVHRAPDIPITSATTTASAREQARERAMESVTAMSDMPEIIVIHVRTVTTKCTKTIASYYVQSVTSHVRTLAHLLDLPVLVLVGMQKSEYGNQFLGCDKCAAGWLNDKEKGCLDINECTAPTSPCGPLQFCVNTEGSYKCLECDNSCAGCTGDGPDLCINCAKGYILKDGMCVGG